MVHHAELAIVQPTLDVAILKFDLGRNHRQAFLQATKEFPHLQISDRTLDEGESVYAFGYPVGSGSVSSPGSGVFVGHIVHAPRVTSAIIASKTERTAMFTALGAPPETYVLDRALTTGTAAARLSRPRQAAPTLYAEGCSPYSCDKSISPPQAVTSRT
jgi:hypothetical protein